MRDYRSYSSSYRPRSNLSRPNGPWPLLGLAGLVLVLILVALGASADEAPAGDEGAQAQASAEGGDEGLGDPESRVESLREEGGDPATARAERPSFDRLQPTPADKDLLARATLENGRYYLDGPGGKRALTIDATLQERMTKLLETYDVPFGALAAIEPATGRVLALAEHSEKNPAMRGLAVQALYPAASTFKIVTGAALLSAGVPASERVCYHGGKRGLTEKLLKDDPRRDRRCTTLANAMGDSTNVVFAKLANRSLDAASLTRWAEKFRFNQPWSFAVPTDASFAKIPEDSLGLATTAAGFGEVFLSPLHGAAIAAAVGNRGAMVGPVLFDDEVAAEHRVVNERLAAELSDMLENTVTSGTARQAFRERGRYVLGEVRAAGKTGSLADKKPFRDYSWFVGWAPKENPTIAVAAVVVNGPWWRVRAPYVGREALRSYLNEQAKQARREARGETVASR